MLNKWWKSIFWTKWICWTSYFISIFPHLKQFICKHWNRLYLIPSKIRCWKIFRIKRFFWVGCKRWKCCSCELFWTIKSSKSFSLFWWSRTKSGLQCCCKDKIWRNRDKMKSLPENLRDKNIGKPFTKTEHFSRMFRNKQLFSITKFRMFFKFNTG